MDGRVFIVFIAFGVAAAKWEGVLYDSLKEQALNWGVYKTGGGVGWEEKASYKVGRGSRKMFSVCDVTHSDTENWVTTPYFNTNGSDVLWVKLKYNIRECLEEEVPVCHFDIYSYETDSNAVHVPLLGTWDYVTTVNTSSPESDITSKIETAELTFTIEVKVKGNKVSIGFKDTGACANILHLQVNVSFCDPLTASLARFPATSTFTSGRKVTGQCVENAEVISEPFSVCNPDGTWNTTNKACKCTDGFQGKDGQKCIAVSLAAWLKPTFTVSMATIFILSQLYL